MKAHTHRHYFPLHPMQDPSSPGGCVNCMRKRTQSRESSGQRVTGGAGGGGGGEVQSLVDIELQSRGESGDNDQEMVYCTKLVVQ